MKITRVTDATTFLRSNQFMFDQRKTGRTTRLLNDVDALIDGREKIIVVVCATVEDSRRQAMQLYHLLMEKYPIKDIQIFDRSRRGTDIQYKNSVVHFWSGKSEQWNWKTLSLQGVDMDVAHLFIDHYALETSPAFHYISHWLRYLCP